MKKEEHWFVLEDGRISHHCASEKEAFALYESLLNQGAQVRLFEGLPVEIVLARRADEERWSHMRKQ